MQVSLTSKPSYLPEHAARGKDLLFSGSLLIEKLETRLGEDGELAYNADAGRWSRPPDYKSQTHPPLHCCFSWLFILLDSH